MFKSNVNTGSALQHHLVLQPSSDEHAWNICTPFTKLHKKHSAVDFSCTAADQVISGTVQTYNQNTQTSLGEFKSVNQSQKDKSVPLMTRSTLVHIQQGFNHCLIISHHHDLLSQTCSYSADRLQPYALKHTAAITCTPSSVNKLGAGAVNMPQLTTTASQTAAYLKRLLHAAILQTLTITDCTKIP